MGVAAMNPLWRSELGQTDDPNALILGNVAAVHETARSLGLYGQALESVGDVLKRIDDGGWKGKAAEAFRACIDVQPKRWLDAADAFEKARTAIVAYAEALAVAKREAQEAVELWKQGVALSKQASVHNPLLLSNEFRANFGGVIGSIDTPIPGDPGAELRDAARDKLDRARQQLDEAGDLAARLVAEARDVAPPNPTLWEQIASFFGGAEGEVRDTAALLDPANWGDALSGMTELAKYAMKDPEGAFKLAIDDETMQDDPARWLGGLAGGALLSKGAGKLSKFGNLPTRLGEHVFRGHKVDGEIKGYHHRHKGRDAEGFLVVKVRGSQDANGVYRGVVYGPDTNGVMQYKPSTFFPDSWTRAQVEGAIIQAFENRQPVYDPATGGINPEKWQARIDGILIEGKFPEGFNRDINSAKLYDVDTAYPKYNK
jgi:hypothetical protein